MKVPDAKSLLLDLFARMHRSGISLGIGELLDALRAAEGGWSVESPADLRELARVLWCRSSQDMWALEDNWDQVVAETPMAREDASDQKHRSATDVPPPPTDPAVSSGRDNEGQSGAANRDAQAAAGWKPLPIRAPELLDSGSDALDFQTYYPVSRRFMVYAWRYLRRPVPDGPPDVLDVDATVEAAAREGYFLAPVYRRRFSNQAHLLLLVDQGGSMVPFHRFTRDLVETASRQSSIAQVDVYYFHNVPAAEIYDDPHLTRRVLFERALWPCTADTSVLVASDAGAARGHRSLERIRATTAFLARIRRHSALLAWLNPMPPDRWPASSAQIIAHLVSMFPMDPDGMSNAIDILRGQPWQRER
jgi:uncharacterized protein with von Willebrand factor type A (vWA) domain